MNAISTPTRFSQEIFDTICERIAEGESLRAICSEPDMPSKWAFLKWLAKDEEDGDGLLVAQYARARDAQVEGEVDEMVLIADTEEDPARARVRIWARQWKAGKMKPKKYGDRVQNDTDITLRRIDRVETVLVSAPEREMKDVTPIEDDGE